MKDVHQHVIHEHLNRFDNVQDVVYDEEYFQYQIQIKIHQDYELN
jgi:hypothetical protein